MIIVFYCVFKYCNKCSKDEIKQTGGGIEDISFERAISKIIDTIENKQKIIIGFINKTTNKLNQYIIISHYTKTIKYMEANETYINCLPDRHKPHSENIQRKFNNVIINDNNSIIKINCSCSESNPMLITLNKNQKQIQFEYNIYIYGCDIYDSIDYKLVLCDNIKELYINYETEDETEDE